MTASATTSDPIVEWAKAISPIVAAFIAVVGVFLTIWFSLRKGAADAKYTYATEVLKLRMRQVEEFYAPMRLLLEQSRAVYDKLLWSLERLGKTNPRARIDLNGFRLLDHAYRILNDRKFKEIRPLVKSILAIGDKLSDLLVTKAGLMEGGLSDTVVAYRAHLEMLKAAAFQRPPRDAREGWQQFGYYPRILNREFAEGYKEAQRHIELFRDAGDEIIWKLLGRVRESRREVIKNLFDNLNYYERNVESYATRFDKFDLTQVRNRFLAALGESREVHLQSTGQIPQILDAGCGTGRDTAEFIRAGYAVHAFDISPAMLRLCKRKIRDLVDNHDLTISNAAKQSEGEELSFDEMKFRNQFNGVWASASLLHVPKVDLLNTIAALIRALKPNGILFMSFRYGSGEAEFDARHYSYLRCRDLKAALNKIGTVASWEMWLSDGVGNELPWYKTVAASIYSWYHRKSQAWLNVVLRKTDA